MFKPLPAAVAAMLLSTAPGLAFAQGAIAGRVTPSGAFDQQNLGPSGLQKCKAFKAVQRHSDALQASDHGRLTPVDTRRLMNELAAAKRQSPRKVTPADCGVPL